MTLTSCNNHGKTVPLVFSSNSKGSNFSGMQTLISVFNTELEFDRIYFGINETCMFSNLAAG